MKVRARPAHLCANIVTSKLIRKRFPLCPFHNNQHFLDLWVTFLEPLKLSWPRCFLIWPTWHFKVAIVRSVRKSACFNLFGKLFLEHSFKNLRKNLLNIRFSSNTHFLSSHNVLLFVSLYDHSTTCSVIIFYPPITHKLP